MLNVGITGSLGILSEKAVGIFAGSMRIYAGTGRDFDKFTNEIAASKIIRFIHDIIPYRYEVA